jgi:osmotically-inducible protein OsmY
VIPIRFLRLRPRRTHTLLVLAAAGLLTACEALLIGGAVVGTSMVVSDRRTAGIQLEDQTIANKAASRAKALATLGRINVSSFNRLVLLTGEVPTDADKAAVEQAVAAVENVRAVVNELAVMPNASFATWSADSVLAAKVKASFVDAADLQANALRVVAERGIVYLMGRVTPREATRAAAVARTVPGVQRVVTVFETLTEEELAAINKSAPAPAAATPATAATATTPAAPASSPK